MNPRWFLLLGALIAASSIAAVFALSHPLPYLDDWETGVAFYRRHLEGALTFSDFWNRYNEHRILFPRLFFLADYAGAQGRGIFPVVFNLALQFLHAFLLHRSVSRAGLDRGERMMFTGLAFAFCFWLVQYENFLWANQVTFVLSGFSASLAAYSFCRAAAEEEENRKRWAWMFAAASACLVSAYSLAGGLFMWLVLFLLGWKARLPGRFLLFWAAFGAGLLGTYFTGADPACCHRPWSEVWSHPLRVMVFFLTYMGNLASKISPATGTAAGAAGVAVAAWIVFRFLIRREGDFIHRFCFAMLSWSLCVGVATALGRYQFGHHYASMNRYHTPALVFWFFVLLSVFLVWRRRIGYSGPPYAAAFIFLAGLVLPVQAVMAFDRVPRWHRTQDEAFLALAAGVSAEGKLAWLWYRGDSTVFAYSDFLRRRRLGPFRTAWSRTLHAPVSGNFVPLAGEGFGGIEVKSPTGRPPHAGFYLQGRVWGFPGGKVPEALVFAAGDTVVGFARTRNRGCRGCFTGYVHAAAVGAPLTCYALDRGNSAQVRRIRLETELRLP